METAAELLNEREDFLHVFATPSVSGEGWDVVLRLDGTYTSQLDAEEAVIAARECIEGLKDVDGADRSWWNGPPWKKKA
jgi:hypothetical protein